MYGDEAIVPLEIEIPSLRVSLEGFILDEEKRKVRFTQIEVLDEKKSKCFRKFESVLV